MLAPSKPKGEKYFYPDYGVVEAVSKEEADKKVKGEKGQVIIKNN